MNVTTMAYLVMDHAADDMVTLNRKCTRAFVNHSKRKQTLLYNHHPVHIFNANKGDSIGDGLMLMLPQYPRYHTETAN